MTLSGGRGGQGLRQGGGKRHEGAGLVVREGQEGIYQTAEGKGRAGDPGWKRRNEWKGVRSKGRTVLWVRGEEQG